MATRLREHPISGYDEDIAAWAETQASALLDRRIDVLDWDNLAEEIVAVAKHERHKLQSALRIILVHLLKWDHQKLRRSRSWWLSVADKRDQARYRLRDSPSLRAALPGLIDKAYRSARRNAATEMDVPLTSLPTDCPYSFDEIMTRPIEWDGELA